MCNCKVEFLEETQGKEVLCADISFGSDYWDNDRKKHALLTVGFDDKAFALFLAAIDYDYDAGYGGQEVFGNIWYKDGTWSERGEYDGSEWWEYKKNARNTRYTDKYLTIAIRGNALFEIR